VLSSLYALEGLVTGLLAVLLWHFWLPAVLALVALDGTASLAASALLRAALARTAREESTRDQATSRSAEDIENDADAAERRANAALNIGFSATFVLGPAIAGAVVAVAGSPTALFIDAASFLICATMLLDLSAHVEEVQESSVGARLRGAWSHINEVPALRLLLVVQAVALIFFESAAPIEVPYAKATLHAGDRGYGLLLTSWGVGVVIGSVIFARSPRRSLGAMLSAGTFAVGLAYVGFAAAPSLIVACLAAVIGGIGNGVQWASLISAVQRLTPQPLLGRMMGAVESVGAVGPALGLSLGGALVALSSPRTAFLVTGVGAAAATGGFVRVSRMGLDGAAPDGTSALMGGLESAQREMSSPPQHDDRDDIAVEEDPRSTLHSASRTSQTP
jgi:MFS family permease